MTPAEYRTALATLGLSQLAAGRWLGVSNKTAQRYATTGPSGAAARAVGMAVAIKTAPRYGEPQPPHVIGSYINGFDLMSAVGLEK